MKKIKYQLTARSFILIEPKNKKEEEVIKNLNNEFDKFKKRNRTYIKNTISIDSTLKKGPYELPDNSMDILDKLIFNEKNMKLNMQLKGFLNEKKKQLLNIFIMVNLCDKLQVKRSLMIKLFEKVTMLP